MDEQMELLEETFTRLADWLENKAREMFHGWEKHPDKHALLAVAAECRHLAQRYTGTVAERATTGESGRAEAQYAKFAALATNNFFHFPMAPTETEALRRLQGYTLRKRG